MRLIKIYVSGIRAEMRLERQALVRAIGSLRLDGALMDLKYSDPKLSREQISSMIYECDMFMVLLDRAPRTGIPSKLDVSLTESEIDQALKLKKTSLFFVKRSEQLDDDNPEQAAFIERVMSLHAEQVRIVDFDDPTHLEEQTAEILLTLLPDIFVVKTSRPVFEAPRAPETFVGRTSWMGQIQRALAPGRIVLIQGISGIGKSELAIQIAHRLRDRFTDGILWADIHSARPDDILAKWARAYGGFPFLGRGDLRYEFRTTSLDERRSEEIAVRANETLRVLTGKRVLAILDGARDERDNPKLIPLMDALRNCAVLITSRTRQLRSSKEMIVFELDRLSESETLELFTRIAGENRIEEQHSLVAEIGRTVDNLPLALSLTAAIFRERHTMSLSALAAILRTERDRLESIKWGYPHARGSQAAINAIHELLSDDDQKFFAALGVFTGDDFGEEAAAAVADTVDYVAGRTLEHLSKLGLVQQRVQPRRYTLHSMIHNYAHDKLEDRDAELRLARHYCSLAKEYGPKLHRLEMRQADRILTNELSNILASQRYALSRNDQAGWILCRDFILGAMTFYFNLHQMWSDWISWSHTGIQACQKLKDERSIISIAGSLGMAYQRKGEWDQAIDFYQTALNLLEKVSNPQGMASIYMNLGSVQTQKGEWMEAITSLNKSLQINERLGNLRGAAQARANIGMLYSKHGEKTKARAIWLQAMEMFQSVGAQNEMDIVRKWLKGLPPDGR
ncbi:MAG: tetratricopeptide repeat protein [Chloroflexi bacterium]|nr:tetratricopeptide repeat protein [Chloroflexota bacterium]